MKPVLLILAVIGFLSVVPAIDRNAQRPRPDRILAPPSLAAWFGTDRLGRDLFSRTILGAARSLMIAGTASAAALLLGTATGLAAARSRNGFPDQLLDLAAAVTMATPFLLVSLAIAVLVPVSGLTLVVIVAITTWGYSFRIVRVQTVLLQQSAFVIAAISFGLPTSRIVLRYLVPNLGHLLLPQALLGAGDVIGIEAGLSFFGIGVTGSRPSLGAMIAESSTSLLSMAWWTFVLPAVVLVAMILSVSATAHARVAQPRG